MTCLSMTTVHKIMTSSGAYNLKTFLEKNNHEIVKQIVELGLSIQTDKM